MRVAIVTESFLPQVNGVANTVRHVAERLLATGHQVLLVAPGPGSSSHSGVPVVRVRSVALPGYRSFPLGIPDGSIEHTLASFSPDLVHLASPIVLGAAGLHAARNLGIPTVAVYQTDVSGFARQYGVRLEPLVHRWVARIHRRCDRTLVPSLASYRQLDAMAVPDLHLWRRGVSLDLFHPGRRSADLHRAWQSPQVPGDSEDAVVVGFVGRLAAEKQVRRLLELADVPGLRLVVIGDGPERAFLERRLPGAVFTGMLRGPELARAFASLDVFVHTGEAETFCQTIQEAQASGVAVVAPAAGGPLDLVDDGHTGLLYAPSDRASLRRSVATLVGDPDLRQDLARAACRQVHDRGWDHVVDELVDLHYSAVLSGHAKMPAA